MVHKRLLTALCIALAAGALGLWAHRAFAAARPLPSPPTITAGKFNPDPVAINTYAKAPLVGRLTPPEKVDVEALVVLNWTWFVDKVQFKPTEDAAFGPVPSTSFEFGISSGGSADANALLVFKPKKPGIWKVTIHANAAYTNSNDTFTGSSAPKDLLLTAIEQAPPTTGPSGGIIVK